MTRERGRRPDLPTEQGAPAPVCEPDPATGHCATCADEALEGRVLELGDDGLARVDLEGTVRVVALDLLDDVRIGERVLVHAGVAIARADS